MFSVSSALRRVSAVATVALASVALVACGGGSSSTTGVNTTTPTKTAGAVTKALGTISVKTTTAPKSVVVASNSIAECMKKHGITLGNGANNQPVAPALYLVKGGPALPSGVTRAQFEAVYKECGGHFNPNATVKSSGGSKGAIASKLFVCMRAQGIPLHEPGRGTSIFQGVDTHSAAFRAAIAKCVPGLSLSKVKLELKNKSLEEKLGAPAG